MRSYDSMCNHWDDILIAFTMVPSSKHGSTEHALNFKGTPSSPSP